VQQLQAQNDDLEATAEALRAELALAEGDIARAARDADALRGRALEEGAFEAAQRQRELREALAELERTRVERDEWESSALRERVVTDEARAVLESARRELAAEREAAQRAVAERDAERENARNLQSVLEDFQAGEPVLGYGGVD
jgi:hypothetical protein